MCQNVSIIREGAQKSGIAWALYFRFSNASLVKYTGKFPLVKYKGKFPLVKYKGKFPTVKYKGKCLIKSTPEIAPRLGPSARGLGAPRECFAYSTRDFSYGRRKRTFYDYTHTMARGLENIP